MNPDHAAAIANRANHIACVANMEAATHDRRQERDFATVTAGSAYDYHYGFDWRRYDRNRAIEFREIAATVAKIMRGEATGRAGPTVSIRGNLHFVIRVDDTPPLPSAVKSLDDLAAFRITDQDRIECGDHLITAYPRAWVDGYHYYLRTVDPDGSLRHLSCDGKIKAEIKAAIQLTTCVAPAVIMAGVGKLAALVRRIHAAMGGFVASVETEAEQRELVNASRHAANVETIWRKWIETKTETVDDDDICILTNLGSH